MHPNLTIRDVADLAKIAIPPEEEPRLAADFAQMLQFAQSLQALDLADVPPTAHIVPVENVLREDTPHVPCAREAMLRNAPTRDEAYITVPPTF